MLRAGVEEEALPEQPAPVRTAARPSAQTDVDAVDDSCHASGWLRQPDR